jgi:hypothetical protein
MTLLWNMVGLIGLLAVAATGCAHNGATEKNLDAKVATEQPTPASDEISAKADRLVSQHPDLSAQQRSDLNVLKTRTQAKLTQMRDESLKLRSVLVEDVLSPNYNKKEVSLIQKRMQKLEGARLTVMFRAVDEAGRILGRSGVQNQQLIQGMLEPKGQRERN